MSLMGRDMRRNRAPGCYLPVYDWSKITSPNNSSYNCVEYVFQGSSVPILDIFSTIYFEFKQINTSYDPAVPNSKQYTTSYLNAGLGLADIIHDYISLYGERPFTYLYYFDESNPNSVEGNKESLDRLRGKLAAILDQNKYKYKRLAETLGFIYDPINNYDMVEEGKDTLTPEGSEKLEHEIDATKLSYVEASGPVIPSASAEGVDVTFVSDKVINTTQKSVSDVRAGRKVKLTTNGEVSTSVATETGDGPATKHYTTTMDDDSEDRLENYDTTEGDTAQASNVSSSVDLPLTGRKTAGSPGAATYTDTKTYETGRKDTKDHELTRKGNIGVTTSQQMIESERQLVRFSILKEFFEDINKELLLSVWEA